MAKAKPPHVRHLRADPNGGFSFNKTKITVSHGKVKLVMKNPGSSGQEHGIAIKGHGLDKDGKTVTPGKTSTVTVTLKKGKTYTFYCPVPGHASLGMKGKIKVS